MSSQQPKKGAYPLTTNNLSHLVSYTSSPAGISITSLISAPRGSLFTPITTSTPTSIPLWSTVQTSADSHIELNSALLYMNHSCSPSLELDTAKMEVRVAGDRDLKEGDELSFFYPSTEWQFSRPFECLCGAGEGVCLGTVNGAKALDRGTLEKRFVNKHIWELVEERDGQ